MWFILHLVKNLNLNKRTVKINKPQMSPFGYYDQVKTECNIGKNHLC